MKTGKLLFVLGFLILITCPVHAESQKIPTGAANAREALDTLCGETLLYDIAFLWFDQLAVGKFTLVKMEEPDRYRAVLEAKTLGVAAWLTSNRLQRYVSYLRLDDDGCLRPESHDADMYKTKGNTVKSRLKNWIYDYSRRIIIEKVKRNGRDSAVKNYAMGEGPTPYDILGHFIISGPVCSVHCASGPPIRFLLLPGGGRPILPFRC